MVVGVAHAIGMLAVIVVEVIVFIEGIVVVDDVVVAVDIVVVIVVVGVVKRPCVGVCSQWNSSTPSIPKRSIVNLRQAKEIIACVGRGLVLGYKPRIQTMEKWT